MPSLELRQLSKSFDKSAVIDDLSLTVEDGELFVLLGSSGCGKSTILRLIAGLEHADRGDIIIGDKIVNLIPPKDRNVAMVFQNYALYPHMTVFDNLAFPLKIRKVSQQRIAEIVHTKAALLGIGDLLSRKPRTLSGGQRQRVALGRVLVREPELFLFDEPLSNLDAKLRVSMRAEIVRLHKELGATMVYVTHDQEEALSLGDRIGILHQGKLQQVGTPREIYANPANLFCAAFVGNPKMNLLEAVLDLDGRLQISPAIWLDSWKESVRKIAINPGAKLIMGIRPENLHFERRQMSDLEIQVEISRIEFAGDKSLVYGRIGDQEIRIRTQSPLDSLPHSSTNLYFASQDCLFFNLGTGLRIV